MAHRENMSALRTQPMRLPRWGTLLTYGRAAVMSTFFSPSIGNLSETGGNKLLHLFISTKPPSIIDNSGMYCLQETTTVASLNFLPKLQDQETIEQQAQLLHIQWIHITSGFLTSVR